MRKLIALLLTAAMLWSLASCGAPQTANTPPVQEDPTPVDPTPIVSDQQPEVTGPVYFPAAIPDGQYRLVGGESYVDSQGKLYYNAKEGQLVYWPHGGDALARTSVDFAGGDRPLHTLLRALGMGSLFTVENDTVTAILIRFGTKEDDVRDLTALTEGLVGDMEIAVGVNLTRSKADGAATASNTAVKLPGFLTRFKLDITGSPRLSEDSDPDFIAIAPDKTVTVNADAPGGAEATVLVPQGSQARRFIFSMMRDGTVTVQYVDPIGSSGGSSASSAAARRAEAEARRAAASSGRSGSGGSSGSSGVTGLPNGVYRLVRTKAEVTDSATVAFVSKDGKSYLMQRSGGEVKTTQINSQALVAALSALTVGDTFLAEGGTKLTVLEPVTGEVTLVGTPSAVTAVGMVYFNSATRQMTYWSTAANKAVTVPVTDDHTVQALTRAEESGTVTFDENGTIPDLSVPEGTYKLVAKKTDVRTASQAWYDAENGLLYIFENKTQAGKEPTADDKAALAELATGSIVTFGADHTIEDVTYAQNKVPAGDYEIVTDADDVEDGKAFYAVTVTGTVTSYSLTYQRSGLRYVTSITDDYTRTQLAAAQAGDTVTFDENGVIPDPDAVEVPAGIHKLVSSADDVTAPFLACYDATAAQLTFYTDEGAKIYSFTAAQKKQMSSVAAGSLLVFAQGNSLSQVIRTTTALNGDYELVATLEEVADRKALYSQAYGVIYLNAQNRMMVCAVTDAYTLSVLQSAAAGTSVTFTSGKIADSSVPDGTYTLVAAAASVKSTAQAYYDAAAGQLYVRSGNTAVAKSPHDADKTTLASLATGDQVTFASGALADVIRSAAKVAAGTYTLASAVSEAGQAAFMEVTSGTNTRRTVTFMTAEGKFVANITDAYTINTLKAAAVGDTVTFDENGVIPQPSDPATNTDIATNTDVPGGDPPATNTDIATNTDTPKETIDIPDGTYKVVAPNTARIGAGSLSLQTEGEEKTVLYKPTGAAANTKAISLDIDDKSQLYQAILNTDPNTYLTFEEGAIKEDDPAP